ncbi:MGMT family protein [Murimonas intestini]|uniref:Methylated-DNA-protein-cysteine methyltransferase-like protein n=1 Tax=Murimonas intestini TaxID=1337051 RepID=A0AB73T378_9FIRM|nr:MGMT family protein [Murimonas intestini]MCR1841567.1 MGMT family protein [Murimonas intestini]MCR1867073.1 MGMT family protein [Murimonas intestini]MCR1884096.1 MGMT family protein [Murimonas intestini]
MDFYKRMEIVCHSIPYGRVCTYGQIALLCGKPKNARQVGFALSHRLLAEDIPAHRIVNSRGILSGAGAFEYPGLQQKLLKKEGICVQDMCVDLKKYGWHNTMDEAEALLAEFERLSL